MNRLRQFWHDAAKVFARPRRLRAVRDTRVQADIPPRRHGQPLLGGAAAPALLPATGSRNPPPRLAAAGAVGPAHQHGQLWRAGRTTRQEVARQLDRGREQVAEVEPLWSG